MNLSLSKMTETREERRLRTRADSLERELGKRNDHIEHLIVTLMDIEKKWKTAVDRAHTLQLEVNRLKKKIGEE